jgi:hypothetical protein
VGPISASEQQVSSERSAISGWPAAKAAKPGRASIRLASEEAYIRAMIVLGRAMHAEGRFKKFFYVEARLLAAGKAALKHGNPGIILADRRANARCCHERGGSGANIGS